MSRFSLCAVVLMAALAVSSAARMPLAAAPAPGPVPSTNVADILFLIEAQQATFQDAQTLVLSGLTSTAQSFATGGRTAVYPIQAFVDATPQSQFVASNGQWLSNPQTVMYGVPSTGGNGTQAILTLSNPKYSQQAAGGIINNNNNNNNNNGGTITNNNNNGPTLTFTINLEKADPATVKVPGGAVTAAASQAAAGAGIPLLGAIAPGSQLTNVVLFIDQAQNSLGKRAETKWLWGGWYQPYYYGNGYNNGYYYNNGWGGSSNNNNNNNNNGGWGANNNNNNNNNNGGYGANNNNNNNNNNGGYGANNNNNNNNNNGGWGANNNNNNNNNGRH